MAVENPGILVISKVPGKQKSKRMLWEIRVKTGRGTVQALETATKCPTLPGKGKGSLFSPAQLHWVIPFPVFTYAETADSFHDLYQIQMVKNNLLNTFLDKLKS